MTGDASVDARRSATADLPERAPPSTRVITAPLPVDNRPTRRRYTARARRAPHGERGPPKEWASPSSGQTMHTASDAVPVAGTPASHRACALASVTVMTALTMAARDRRSGTMPTMLIVPGPGSPVSTASSGAAAHVGRVIPTDTSTAPPPSSSLPHLAKIDGREHADARAARARAANASSARWVSGSRRA